MLDFVTFWVSYVEVSNRLPVGLNLLKETEAGLCGVFVSFKVFCMIQSM